jgi:hypothetical protein
MLAQLTALNSCIERVVYEVSTKAQWQLYFEVHLLSFWIILS